MPNETIIQSLVGMRGATALGAAALGIAALQGEQPAA